MTSRLGIRTRVTLAATAVTTVVLVVAGIALVVAHQRALTGALDESLALRAAELAAQGTGVPSAITGLGDDDAFAQVVREADGDRHVLASSTNAEGMGPVVDADSPRLSTVTVPALTEERLRVLVHDSGDLAIIVGSPTDDVEDSVATLRRSLLVALPLVILALVMVLWWLTGRALRPIEAIRAEVAGIGARDLHRRVPVPAADDEVARLAHTMNEMLERVEDSAHRQRRFLADASHELRSPLTRMRTELEVDLAHPADADPLATHAALLAETIGLQHLTEDLLLAARTDEGVAAGTHVVVDLDDVVLLVARRLRTENRAVVDISGVSAGRVMGDRDMLARAVVNLADNAARHAASVIAFGLCTEGDSVTLTVADDGPGVPASERERIFERFARVDDARRSGDGGTGLGLAIARDIAELHGGTLVLDPTAEGTTFTLTLPSTT